jgi:hypothetical protein
VVPVVEVAAPPDEWTEAEAAAFVGQQSEWFSRMSV